MQSNTVFFQREREREREYNIPFHCKSHYSATAELIHHIFNVRSFIQVDNIAWSIQKKIISADKNTTIKKQVDNDKSS